MAAEEARAVLVECHAVLGSVDTIAAFAKDMSEFRQSLAVSWIPACAGMTVGVEVKVSRP